MSAVRKLGGSLALVGGGEFQRACDEMDRALIELAGGPGALVGIVPAAAARENPRLAAQNGVRHFNRLGARAEAVMIVDRAGAQSTELAARIDDLALVYLAGGDPVYLLETLRDSAAWSAMLQLVERGGVLAGSSAGAMVMGGQMWAPGEGWRPGLGALPRLAVLPHHATLSARWDAARMRLALPDEVVLVGLDECTGLVAALGGGEWRVMGAGEASLYRGPAVEALTPGQTLAPSDFSALV
jgi:cyanophycinase